jgi:ATP-dependent exoDNAse (exonuclease V) alpha subunit
VLNGDLGTVTATHADTGSLTIRLDRHPVPICLPAWYLQAGHLDHGYAVTCHKAQGATVDKAFVVASGSITREWAYVAMSRGRAANTMYLAGRTDHEDCDHVVHDRSEEADRLAVTLARIEAQTAAIDSGPTPQPDSQHSGHRQSVPRQSPSVRRSEMILGL